MMKFAKDTRNMEDTEKVASAEVGEVLAEALPWIKAATGKTIIIKYGGSAMVDERLREDVMSDIVLLKIMGMNPVIIHGGGAAITDAMERFNMPVEFKKGLRVTSDEAMDIVRMVLVGEVNQDLVRDVNRHGNLAVGISGADAGTVMAESVLPELGRVGRVTSINTGLLEGIISEGYIPVVASVGMGEDGGYFNINADAVAGEIASAIGAHKIIFLTDVDGLYRDFDDKGSLISNMTLDEANALIEAGGISAGMIPKLRSCVSALHAGVFRAHIINGTTPHSLLLELLTDAGVGTVIHRTEELYRYDTHPLGKVASKLIENVDDRKVEDLKTDERK